MSVKDTEALQRLFSQFSRDALKDIPPHERAEYQRQLQERYDQLLKAASNGRSGTAFTDLIGLSGEGALPFGEITQSTVESDFDESVVPTQLHAAADLYSIYQFERMKVFQVVSVIMRLFHDGRMRIQRGPGARALYLLEKHAPLRYRREHRMLAYRRVFNYGTRAAPPGAVVYQGFHRQFVAFTSAVAQYFRDLLIGEVIRGAQLIEQRPFGSQATIQRHGADLRWQLDRATYGFIVPLTIETSNYLKTVLDALETPDIKKAFDANTKWDVIEIVSQRYLGGAAEISQRTRMAEAGKKLLSFVADNPFRTRDFHLFQTEIQPLGPIAEEWIAAYRMTPEGRSFRGVAGTLGAARTGGATAAPAAAAIM